MNTLIPRRYRRAAVPALRDVGPLDRLFDDMWRGFALTPRWTGEGQIEGFAPRVNIRETEKDIVITAELPGVEEKDFQVSLEDDLLILKGEKRSEHESEEGGYRHVETMSGSFERRFVVPGDIDPESVKAAFKNGVLTVTLPKPKEETPAPRQIPIQIA